LTAHSDESTRPARLQRQGGLNVFRLILGALLQNLTIGSLTIVTPHGEAIHHRGRHQGPEAIIHVHRWRVVRRLLLEGNIGFAKSYLDGDWTTPGIAAVIDLAARNESTFKSTIDGLPPVRLINYLRHARRANTLSGSRRNIMDHYDLGNEFFALWLDREMNYSSAIYDAPNVDLEAAQAAKQDYIIDQLALSGGERVLEIGCGWGSLAERLIRRGCNVTGLTLSPAQRDYTMSRLATAGLSDRADIRLQDYRKVEGQFDRIVSIEMLEAVGQRYWPVYFDVLRQRLEKNGVAAIQVITIEDKRFEAYRSASDFIQHYIFPGGMLPTLELMREHISQAGLDLVASRAFGSSYAATLAEWTRRFQTAWPTIEQQGFDQRFRRMWDYYLGYCEGGFRSGVTDVGLYVLSRGDAESASRLQPSN
jgi:cyclopropane-fatty-acyl-phospholipid synthase